MKLTIGVMGASGGDPGDEVRQRAYRLGEAIAEHDAILVTGACPGLPYEAVRRVKAEGGLVVGISPGLSIDEHQGKYRSPVEVSMCSCIPAAALRAARSRTSDRATSS